MRNNGAALQGNNRRDGDSRPKRDTGNRVDTFENLEDVGEDDCDVHDCEVDDDDESDRQGSRLNGAGPQDPRGYAQNQHDLRVAPRNGSIPKRQVNDMSISEVRNMKMN